MASDDSESSEILHSNLHFVAVKEEGAGNLEAYTEQSSSVLPSTSNYVENVGELNYDEITLWTENVKYLQKAVVDADGIEGIGKCFERIKGIKEEVEFKSVLTDPALCLKDHKFHLRSRSSAESVTEIKAEIEEKLNYEEIALSTQIVKQLEKPLGDGTECSGPGCSAVCSESYKDINQEEESKNVLIGHQGCLEQLKSPLQCSSESVKFQGDNIIRVEWGETSGEKAFCCRICGISFTQNSLLKEHARIHSAVSDCECNVCGAKFTRKASLKFHNGIHTREKPLNCKICGYKFRGRSALKRHMRTHTGDRPFNCEICGSKFAVKYTLKRHMVIHTGEKAFSCEICRSKFGDNYRLQRHMEIHSGEKVYDCEICGTNYIKKKGLKKHMRIHTNVKSFYCEKCESKFRNKFSLKRHMKIHTGENPFICDICGSKFREKANLKRHMANHTGEKQSVDENLRITIH